MPLYLRLVEKIFLILQMLAIVGIVGGELNSSRVPKNIEVIVQEGESTKIKCIIEDLSLDKEVQWVTSLGKSNFRSTKIPVATPNDYQESTLPGIYWEGDISIGEYNLYIPNSSWSLHSNMWLECQVVQLRKRITRVTLTVYVFPTVPRVTTTNDVVNAKAGEFFNFTCLVENTYPPANLSWKISGFSQAVWSTKTFVGLMRNDYGAKLYNTVSRLRVMLSNVDYGTDNYIGTNSNPHATVQCEASNPTLENEPISTLYSIVLQRRKTTSYIHKETEKISPNTMLFFAVGIVLALLILISFVILFIYRRRPCTSMPPPTLINVEASGIGTVEESKKQEYISMSPSTTHSPNQHVESYRSVPSHVFPDADSTICSDQLTASLPAIQEDYNFSLINAGFGHVHNTQPRKCCSSNMTVSSKSCSGPNTSTLRKLVRGTSPQDVITKTPPEESFISYDVSENLPSIPPEMPPLFLRHQRYNSESFDSPLPPPPSVDYYTGAIHNNMGSLV